MFNVVAREKFFELTKEACQESFKVNIEKVLAHLAVDGKVNEESIRSLLFGDYMDPERFYDEVTDIPELIKTMEQYVKQFDDCKLYFHAIIHQCWLGGVVVNASDL